MTKLSVLFLAIFLALTLAKDFRAFRNSMHHIADDMHKDKHKSENFGRTIAKKFDNFEDFVTNVASTNNKKVFKIQPAHNVVIRFAFSKPGGGSSSGGSSSGGSSSGGNSSQGQSHHKGSKYYLNFAFNNYKNPKNPQQQPNTNSDCNEEYFPRTNRLKGRRNPYKYFPLKGEDI